ncbi:hypothetical protein EPA93_37685 [Ktedonosporobacter rubrisoli]|uniref:Glycosyltransferase RgtA/B/C/D-like domain-containing protein n=1 Tax=Ktedonosporobacter rubrisoli TaxID=2509675 RepID=A0A4V0YZZ1_KTERU|nr:glycosyltransferase family 39 protein [Ktedonosporobacter rubrisoli]QBD81401.1 hypothetical protein EPA93_37685 [Ktedonosporobacter rubrisoli]
MPTSIESADHSTEWSAVNEGKRDVAMSRLRALLAKFWPTVILPYLGIRLLLELVGLTTIYYILPLIKPHQPIYPDPRMANFPAMLWLMWQHFDSGFYLSIAQQGYWGAQTLHGMSNWAFFPLYPLLIRLFTTPFGTSDDAFRLVALLVSNLAAIVAGIFLYKLTRRELGDKIAARTVLYLAIFPMGFYLAAIYPESLFLALAVSCTYYARQQRWWIAGLLGGLAALTRPQGVLLAVIVGWEYWQYLAEQFAPYSPAEDRSASIRAWLRSRFLGLWQSLRAWRTWLGFAALLLIPLGLALFCAYGKWKVGTFLPFEDVERSGWGRSALNPLQLMWHMLRYPRPANPYDWNFYALNMLVIVLFLLSLIPILRKLPFTYGLFALLFILMPLSSGITNSIARYYMEVFPVFMLLAWWTSQGSFEQQLRRHNVIVIGFALLLSLGMVMFTLGIYSMS